MTPATLARLSGLLHHIPDARDLRILGADGTPSALHPAAAEVYAAVPELVEFARQRDADATGKTEAIRHHHADIAALYAALRFPASTHWPNVLARARRLADIDPGRTLDEDTEVRDG